VWHNPSITPSHMKLMWGPITSLLLLMILPQGTAGGESGGISASRAERARAAAAAHEFIHQPREDARSVCLKCEENICSIIPHNRGRAGGAGGTERAGADSVQSGSKSCYEGENAPVYRFYNMNDNELDVQATHSMSCGSCAAKGYATAGEYLPHHPIIQEWNL
jgi:hypothetical protein